MLEMSQPVTLDYKEIYNTSASGYFSTSNEEIIIEGNNTFFSLIGYSRKEIIDKRTLSELLTTGSKLYFETNITPKLHLEGRIKEINLELEKNGNARLPVLINATQIKDENDILLYTRWRVFDISKRKEYELELLKAKTKADELLSSLLKKNKELEIQTELIQNQKNELEHLNKLLQKQNKALEISDHNQKVFFDSSLSLLSTHDLEGNLLSWNKAYIQTLGYSENELINGGIDLLIPQENKYLKEHYFAEIQRTKKISGETKLICKDGSIKNIIYHHVLEIDRGGKEYVISNAIDITEKHSLMLELSKTKKLLEKTNKIARLGSWEYNLEDKSLHWSGVTKEIHQESPDYEPDLNTAVNFYKEGYNRDRILTCLNEAIQNGKSWNEEFQIITKTGKEIWVKAFGNAEFISGNCRRIYGSFQDIDEKKRAELKIKETQKLLNDVLDSATEVGIISTDQDGVITLFNKGAEKILGDKSIDIVGRFAPQVLRHIDEEIIKRGQQLTEELGYPVEGFQIFVKKAELGISETMEWAYIKKDDSKITVEMMVTVIRDDYENIIGYLAVFVNISDLKKAKIELELNAEKMQNQNEKLLNFAHIASHNLRSPVSNLNSLLFFYKESKSTEDKELLFSKFEKVILHLTQTLNELIESIKIQGATDLKQEPILFQEVYDKASEILIGQIMESGAKITFDFSKAPILNYHRPYLDSIILNLFSNTIRYRSPKRIPEVHFETNIQNNKTILTVKDNGLGIDLDKHGNKLFGLSKTFHRNSDAKGLGLFMTKTQIVSMGGKITLESEVEKGSTFKIEF